MRFIVISSIFVCAWWLTSGIRLKEGTQHTIIRQSSPISLQDRPLLRTDSVPSSVSGAESSMEPEVCSSCHTLPASLSGTFLQTPPELVTPLKGHSSSPRSCPPTQWSAPSILFYSIPSFCLMSSDAKGHIRDNLSNKLVLDIK